MQLISRAAAILRALEGQPAGLSLGQIAKATGLPRPTVQRIVDALKHEGLLSVDALRGGVRLGVALARLGASVDTDLLSIARPHFENLSWELRETVAMTVLREGRAVLIGIANTPGPEIQLTSKIGGAWHLHCTADGKALLASLPQETVGRHLIEPLERRTAHTITSVPALLAEVAEAARNGYAIDRDGMTEGISAIATGVQDMSGSRYAISLIVPSTRFAARLPELREALERCRATVQAAAGT